MLFRLKIFLGVFLLGMLLGVHAAGGTPLPLPDRVVVVGTGHRRAPNGTGVDHEAYSQDLVAIVAAAAGLKYRIVEFDKFSLMMAAFERGKIDVVPTVARFPERESRMLFSVPHVRGTLVAITRTNAAALASPAELAAKRIAVVPGTIEQNYLGARGWLSKAVLVGSSQEALSAVVGGRADATIINEFSGLALMRALGLERQLTVAVTLPDSVTDFCMAVRLGDPLLLAQLNDGLFLAQQRGDLRRNYEKWFSPVESSEFTRERFYRWLIGGGVGAGVLALLAWTWYGYRLSLARRRTEEVVRIVQERTRELALALKSLEASERKFSKAFRSSPDAITISMAADGRLIEVNQGFTELLGFAAEEAVGRTPLELGYMQVPADHERLTAALRRDGRIRDFDFRFKTKVGALRTAVLSAEMVEIGENSCVVTIVRDITEQRLAEAALLANERQFRTFVENASVGIYRSTPDGRIVMANPTLIRIMGYDSFEDLASRNLELDGYEPNYARAEFKTRIERTGSLSGLEAVWRKKDGTSIFVRESASVIRGADGAVLYYDGIIEDISERKQAEEALRESEERFRNLTAAAFEGIVITEGGRILDINDQALKMLGYEQSEMIGREAIEFVCPESRPIVAEHIRKQWEVVYQHKMMRKDGSSFQAEAQAKMMRLGGRALRMTALRDITERLQHEARQKNLEEQLRQTQKMEALGTLAGGISHDFNNILTGIVGNLQLAQLDLAAGHPAQTALKSADQACRRARELVARILAFSRLEPEHRVAASLGAAVLEAVQLARVGLPSGVEIRTEIEPSCPFVVFDSNQIHQVVMNLVTNSIHAMRDSGGVLAVELCSIIPSGALRERNPLITLNHTVRLTVRDSGCGMDAAVLKRIFEPFFTTKDPGQGTGLGLAMVHAIVRSHNGVIVVESTPSRGTVFELYFLGADGGKSLSSQGSAQLGREEFSAFGNGRRILLVEDHDTVRNLGTSLLRRLGFVPLAFERPLEALGAFKAAPDDFAAVISDFTMPEMNGLELARQMLAVRADIPVILTSGHLLAETQQKARSLGVRAIISKPFEVSEMIAQLRTALSGAGERLS